MDVDTLVSSTGDLPSPPGQHRHFPIAADRSFARPHTRTRNYIVRATAKRYANAPSAYLCQELGLPCSPGCARCSDSNPVTRRARIEKDLRAETAVAYRYRRARTRTPWTCDESEACELARSAIPLPSDRFRLTRTPSLEREDAFRDASTSKGNVRLRRNQSGNEEAEVAELYRMGLLYDDEQDRGEGFSLNSIEHQEPVFTIRPAKRSRKNRTRRYTDVEQPPLHLDLSFTDLGGDQTIAQYLSGNNDTEPSDDGSIQQSSTRTSRIFAPLRVIYELDGSDPDIDVETSQPPDLVSDLISDYDCFSDSDLDDLPSQREVHDSAAAPASEAWVVLGDDS